MNRVSAYGRLTGGGGILCVVRFSGSVARGSSDDDVVATSSGSLTLTRFPVRPEPLG